MDDLIIIIIIIIELINFQTQNPREDSQSSALSKQTIKLTPTTS
jgi:hypothetical protein